MTGPISTPRYSAEDFETASIRSTAPSYVSEVPSYHSTAHHGEQIPAYSPPAPRAAATGSAARPTRASAVAPRRQTIGLPPVPSMPQLSIPNLHNYRIPTWSTNNALAARQYHSVAERRISDGRYSGAGVDRNVLRRVATPERLVQPSSDSGSDSGGDNNRPLEDPYLVGEEAAAVARRERLARETGDDILIREDKHWDWLLTQMKTWDERERSWNKFRQVETSHRKKFMRRLGGGLL